jgi:prepilin-type N-terminal cleavage/methylation domain-containing protein
MMSAVKRAGGFALLELIIAMALASLPPLSPAEFGC